MNSAVMVSPFCYPLIACARRSRGSLPCDSSGRWGHPSSHHAVSYTHLDVYKRQMVYMASEQAAIELVCPDAENIRAIGGGEPFVVQLSVIHI